MYSTANFDSTALFSFLPSKDCLSPHVLCYNMLNITDKLQPWMGLSNIICYVTLPVLIIFGFLGELLNIIVFMRQIRLSVDTYLMGISLSSFLLFISATVLYIQHYIGQQDFLAYLQGHALSCHDWFKYTVIWLIVMTCLERALTVSSTVPQYLCSSIQAGIVVSMVFCVGIVSALPRFWEYEAIQKFDTFSNKSVFLSMRSETTDSPQYNQMYFWYVKCITVLIPLPLMLILTIPMCRHTCRSGPSNQRITVKHSRGMILNRKMKEETDLNKLLTLLVLIYLLMIGPVSLLELLGELRPDWLPPNTVFYLSVHNILLLWSYLNYPIHSMLYFCYNKQFRLTLLSDCCCCC